MSRTADVLVEAIMLDCMPRPSACVDFGLDNGNVQQRYEAYYYPVHAGEITADQLHEALVGKTPEPVHPLSLAAVMRSKQKPVKHVPGKALTELLQNAHYNPHKSVEITTAYDLM